ncbi:MAG: DUF1932 domain-containing protein [Anaerolineales bacterium]|nr:DUF1932 domain-containing protein [Anaerolineales bacterium]
MTLNVGILHPGEMGISVAACAQNSCNNVYWASQGRSVKTRTRAEEFSLLDAGTLAQLCATCSVIVSVCPPDADEDMADGVLALGFAGLYMDANAISPGRAERIGLAMTAGGAAFVDGGIIGGPVWELKRTWLYLSGEQAQEAAALFSAGPLETAVIGDEIGKASALKMCYAAYTKGTSALLCAILASAEALDVRADLERQWSRGGSDFAEQTTNRVRRVTAKAWRFAGEMDEIADTFESAGLPGGFHAAAGMIYERMARFKDAASTPELDAVLDALLDFE